MNRKKNGINSGISFYLLLIFFVIMASFVMQKLGGGKDTTLSDLQKIIEAGKVKSITLADNTLNIELTDKDSNTIITKNIHELMIPRYVEIVEKAYNDGKIESYDYHKPFNAGFFFQNITMLVMASGILFFLFMMARQRYGDGGGSGFVRSRAKLSDPKNSEVTFADVAGADEEKEELQEVVSFLSNPQKYTALGARIPKGILMVGPPGTGKTLIAKAVAGEAKVPFFSISGSDFVELYVGVGASRVRDMFKQAKKLAPSIIFIDEIDAVGRQRGAGLGGGHDEREQTLNQLLVEMDGFGPNEGVIIMAATNRPDILDPALLRPGRFDRRVTVHRPDLGGREAILKVHAKNKPLEANVDLREIAKITPGFTGADLANLLNEAALLAARNNAAKIKYTDISEAVFKITVGTEKKSRVITPKERELTAYHEGGHAIILRAVSETQRVERVTIIPAGDAGGYTAYKPNEDLSFHTRKELLHSIMHALGGRAAEELTQDDISTGAYSDLQFCNKIARDMITKYGMSKHLGNFVLETDDEVFLGRDYGHANKYSEVITAKIDQEVKEIIAQCYEEVLSILQKNRLLMDKLAERLLAKEKIEGPEFEELYAEYAVDFKPLPKNSQGKYISQLAEEGVPEIEKPSADHEKVSTESLDQETTEINGENPID